DLALGLIEPPALAYGSCAGTKVLLDLRRILDDPVVKGGVIDCHPPLLHHFFELAIAEWVGHIPSHSPEDNLFFEMSTLAVHPPVSTPASLNCSIARHVHVENLSACDRTSCRPPPC